MRRQNKKKSPFFGKCIAAIVGTAALLSFDAASVFAQDSLQLPLTQNDAEALALLDAGIDSADAERVRAKQEREDREDVVEVEFICQNDAYEYTIRCADGMILEWQVEGRDVSDAAPEQSLGRADRDAQAAPFGDAGTAETTDTEKGAAEKSAADGNTAAGEENAVAADGTVLIGLSRAKEIARAQMEDDALEFTKLHFELDDGRYYDYEFEFYSGNRMYECTIDAQTGEVIQLEMDD